MARPAAGAAAAAAVAWETQLSINRCSLTHRTREGGGGGEHSAPHRRAGGRVIRLITAPDGRQSRERRGEEEEMREPISLNRILVLHCSHPLRSKECPAVALHSLAPFHRMTTMKLLTFVPAAPLSPSSPTFIVRRSATSREPSPSPSSSSSHSPPFVPSFSMAFVSTSIWLPPHVGPHATHAVPRGLSLSLFCITVLELEKPLPDGLRVHAAGK